MLVYMEGNSTCVYIVEFTHLRRLPLALNGIVKPVDNERNENVRPVLFVYIF